MGITVYVNAEITDSVNGGANSKVYLWDLADATKSLGAALVDPSGSGCPNSGPGDCPAAEPPNWPANLGSNPAKIVSGANVSYLSFVMPASANTVTYEYWMRAFGVGAIYDIDPKIINQPV